MIKFMKFIKSPHIQIALVTGFSIIVMAYFSKRILPEPIGYIPLAIPPFIATLFEALLGKYPESKLLKAVYWVAAILIATFLVIVLNF